MKGLKIRVMHESDEGGAFASVHLPDGREVARIVALAHGPDEKSGEVWLNIDVIATHGGSGTDVWPLGEHVDTFAGGVERRVIPFSGTGSEFRRADAVEDATIGAFEMRWTEDENADD